VAIIPFQLTARSFGIWTDDFYISPKASFSLFHTLGIAERLWYSITFRDLLNNINNISIRYYRTWLWYQGTICTSVTTFLIINPYLIGERSWTGDSFTSGRLYLDTFVNHIALFH
jgi:hypothetical protein